MKHPNIVAFREAFEGIHTRYAPFKTHYTTFWSLVISYYCLDCRIGIVIVFEQLMTSYVLLWSTAVEETCFRGSDNRKLSSSVLMM